MAVNGHPVAQGNHKPLLKKLIQGTYPIKFAIAEYADQPWYTADDKASIDEKQYQAWKKHVIKKIGSNIQWNDQIICGISGISCFMEDVYKVIKKRDRLITKREFLEDIKEFKATLQNNGTGEYKPAKQAFNCANVEAWLSKMDCTKGERLFWFQRKFEHGNKANHRSGYYLEASGALEPEPKTQLVARLESPLAEAKRFAPWKPAEALKEMRNAMDTYQSWLDGMNQGNQSAVLSETSATEAHQGLLDYFGNDSSNTARSWVQLALHTAGLALMAIMIKDYNFCFESLPNHSFTFDWLKMDEKSTGKHKWNFKQLFANLKKGNLHGLNHKMSDVDTIRERIFALHTAFIWVINFRESGGAV